MRDPSNCFRRPLTRPGAVCYPFLVHAGHAPAWIPAGMASREVWRRRLATRWRLCEFEPKQRPDHWLPPEEMTRYIPIPWRLTRSSTCPLASPARRLKSSTLRTG